MQILTNAPQGSPAWLTARATRFCASEAAAALGVSKYQTRSDLLKQKATGISEEVTPAKQRLYDSGHESERAAGPIAESIAGVEFYPAVGIADIEGLPLLASFDGIDSVDEILWENKLRNAALVGQVADRALEPHYWAQLEHQLLVSDGMKVLFTVSDGTEAGTDSMWYESVPERRAQLIAAWKQFAIDLATYAPQPVKAEAVAKPVAGLPVVFDMRVEGKLVACNIDAYKPAALEFIAAINTELVSDQHFADANADANFCRESADKLNLAIEQALGQMGDINAAITSVRDIANAFDAKGLALEKLVKAEKENRRLAIVIKAREAYAAHEAELIKETGGPWIVIALPDFATVTKGLKTIASIQNAVDTELARGKIAADASAKRIRANLACIKDGGAGFEFLFNDRLALIDKPLDHLQLLVKTRIAEHQAAELAKEEATRNRIRAEEQAKAEAAVREAERVKAAEAERLAREAEAKRGGSALPANRPMSDREWSALPSGDRELPHAQVYGSPPAPAANVVPITRTAPAPQAAPATPPTLKLGDINALLSPVNLTADGLTKLGFPPAATDKSAKLYHARDMTRICAALHDLLDQVQAKQAA